MRATKCMSVRRGSVYPRSDVRGHFDGGPGERVLPSLFQRSSGDGSETTTRKTGESCSRSEVYSVGFRDARGAEHGRAFLLNVLLAQ